MQTELAGDYDIGIAIGLDKHPRGAFTEDPALVGMPRWYAENGQYLTTKFFGMKANRYLHDHGISPPPWPKVAAKNFRNGALNPNAFRRRKPIAEEEILNSPMLNYPLTQHVLRPRRGRGGGGHVLVLTSPTATPTSRCTCGRSRCGPDATARTR